jgi:serine/threonine-protein kinase HipA
LAKRYNIKGANSIIDKTILIVGNNEHYAKEAGVPPHWIQKITEESGYRIEKVGSVL